MKKTDIKVYIIFIFCALACGFTIASAYPGFMSPDSLDQYGQAKINQYSDWHPPIMAWIWNKLLWINDGPFPMLLLNNMLYWVAVVIIAIKLNRFWLSFVFILLSSSPPLINFIGMIWKDTFLFDSLFFISAILFWLYDNHLKKSVRLVLFLLITVLSFIAIMIRYNAAPALVPILGINLLVSFKKIKPLIALLVGFLVTLVLFYTGQQVNDRLCDYRSQYPEQQLMLYDLLGISQQAQINLFPEYLKNKVTLDTINRIYNHNDGGMYLMFSMNCRTHNNDQINNIRNAWNASLLHYPIFAFNHKYESFKSLQLNPLPVNYSYIDPKSFDAALIEQNIFRKVFRNYNECKIAHKFYVPNDYFIGCLVIVLISLIVFCRTKNQRLLIPIYIGLSGFLYSASYFVLSPCNELRYNYWTIGAFFLSGTFLLNAFTNRMIKKS